jgi:hypothetical protein
MVDFARQTFEVPMLLGPVEDQAIAPASLDVIALMDVLEHLSDPVSTMRHCLGLLKPDGVIVIQTPRYPEGKTYAEMTAQNDPFLEQFKANEHLHLFSQSSIRELFRRLGAEYLTFEPAIFAHYDMFVVVSQEALDPPRAEAVEQALMRTTSGRLTLALLDAQTRRQEVEQKLERMEADRAARLAVIEQQGQQLGELEAERNNLRGMLTDLRQQFEAAEADRTARLAVIERQGQQLGELEAERNNLSAMLADLRQQLEAAEADRAARLAVIERQGRDMARLQQALGESEQVRLSQQILIEAHEEQVRILLTQLRTMQTVLHAIQRGRVYRLLRRLGRWGWVEEALAQDAPTNGAVGSSH